MRIILIINVCILLLIAGCENKIDTTEKEKGQAIEKEKMRLEQSISAMVSKYNATDWKKDLPESQGYPFLSEVYTIDIKKALIRNDTPIFFRSIVADIVEQDDKYFVYFHNPYAFSYDNIYFILECDEKLISKILAYERTNEYAVIGEISSVRKPLFSIVAEPISIEEAELAINTNMFIVRGRCLDLLPTGRETWETIFDIIEEPFESQIGESNE